MVVAVGQVKRALAALPLVALLLTSGCYLLDRNPEPPPTAPPPTGVPTQAMLIWSPQVLYGIDPTRPGGVQPGFCGRLVLFCENMGTLEGAPVVCDGTVDVDLYDSSGPEPVLKEKWHIDPESLKKYLTKDVVGWGYRLFLPSATYRPEMTRVTLQLCFTPVHGVPVRPAPHTMALTTVTEGGTPPTPPGPTVSSKPKG